MKPEAAKHFGAKPSQELKGIFRIKTLVLSSTPDSGRRRLRFTRRGCLLAIALLAAAFPARVRSQVSVTTSRNDLARTGQNLSETNLTPANVNSSSFGKLFTQTVDGYVYGQPLYLPGVAIPGAGTHNVVYVVTEHDSIYAFDADSNQGSNSAPLWHTSFINPAAGVTTLTSADVGTSDIVPEIGISATPVIDPSSGTIYVLAKTKEISGGATKFVQRLHALDFTTGLERSNSPVVIKATYTGNGDGGSAITFNPLTQHDRPGLVLFNGIVYLTFASHGDNQPYHGWVLGYDAQSLQQVRVHNNTPNGSEGGIWQSGCAPAVDTNGFIYFMTGNGTFSPAQGNYGDSFEKLGTNSPIINVADYFTPYNQATLDANDTDLGSGGVVLLPDSAGSATHPHLLIGCGKEGTVYLVDRDNMGKYNTANNNQIVQSFAGPSGGTWSGPAFFNNTIYYGGSGNSIQAYKIANGRITPTPSSSSTFSIGFPGASPSVSANGTNNAIVWVIQGDGYSSRAPEVLHALNANNLAQEYYNSSQAGARDVPGPAVKFVVPTVANGKVYVGAEYAVSIYGVGEFLTPPVITPAGANFTNSINVSISLSAQDLALGAQIHYTTDNSTPTLASPVYTGPITLTNTTVVKAAAFATNAVAAAAAPATFLTGSSIGTGTGLKGTYYSNQLKTFNNPPSLVRIDPTINFNWNTVSPAPGITQTDFTAKWTGSVQAPLSEPYTFYTTTDDGVRLYVNGALIINEWVDQGPTTWSGAVNMVAGQKYSIEMDYYQNQGGAVASLAWSSPSTAEEIIPSTQLYPPVDVPPAVALSSPANGAAVTAPTNIILQATSTSTDGLVASVKFYASTNLIGTATKTPYQVTWPNPAPGAYQLFALAADTLGGTNYSTVSSLTILPPNLALAVATNGLVFTWPSVSGSLVLESTPSLVPPVVWSPENLTFTAGAQLTSATLTNITGSLFFRLRPQ